MHSNFHRPLLAALTLTMLTPVAAWWCVGDMTDPELVDPDFSWRAPPIDPQVELIGGVLATIGCLLGVAALVRWTVRGSLDLRWLTVAGAGLGAGAIAGAGGRVMTAGVIGANIGGGLVMLFGGPMILLLLLFATAMTVRIGTDDRSESRWATPLR